MAIVSKLWHANVSNCLQLAGSGTETVFKLFALVAADYNAATASTASWISIDGKVVDHQAAAQQAACTEATHTPLQKTYLNHATNHSCFEAGRA